MVVEEEEVTKVGVVVMVGAVKAAAVEMSEDWVLVMAEVEGVVTVQEGTVEGGGGGGGHVREEDRGGLDEDLTVEAEGEMTEEEVKVEVEGEEGSTEGGGN